MTILEKRVAPAGAATLSRAITRAYGKSFYFASFALPVAVRSDAYDLYALCRLMDDLTDEAKGDSGSEVSELLIGYLFSKNAPAPHLRNTLAAAMQQTWSHLEPGREPCLYTHDYLSLLDRIKDTILRCGIGEHHLRELLQGQKDDEHFVQPKNWEQLYIYCYRVAGVVGLMMALVIGAARDKKTLLGAEHLGIAMQITNILRDVREDYEQRNRVYLPQDMCEASGLSLQGTSPFATQPQETIGVVMQLAERGLFYYASGLAGVPGIPSRRCRLCVRLMAAVYGAILAQVMRHPARALSTRVFTTLPKKIWIGCLILCGVSPLRAAGFCRARIQHDLLQGFDPVKHARLSN